MTAKPPSRRLAAAPRAPDVDLFQRIRSLVLAARQTVARGVDLVQVHTCFEIGRHIVQHEQQGQARAGYGQELLKTLAERLSAEFGRGFSKSNLEYMRRFYLAYETRAPIAQPATGQLANSPNPIAALPIAQFATGQSSTPATASPPFALSWTHYVFLLGITNPDERSFYEIEAAEQGWNLRELFLDEIAAFDAESAEAVAAIRELA